MTVALPSRIATLPTSLCFSGHRRASEPTWSAAGRVEVSRTTWWDLTLAGEGGAAEAGSLMGGGGSGACMSDG